MGSPQQPSAGAIQGARSCRSVTGTEAARDCDNRCADESGFATAASGDFPGSAKLVTTHEIEFSYPDAAARRERRVAVVEEPQLRLLDGCATIYDLATECLLEGVLRYALHGIEQRKSTTVLDYEPIYQGQSDWRLQPSADFPTEPARCLVSGTGLTHQASAKNRDAMHAAAQAITDSTRMYLSGVEGGKPAPGEAGISPEWFYKALRNRTTRAWRTAGGSRVCR